MPTSTPDPAAPVAAPAAAPARGAVWRGVLRRLGMALWRLGGGGQLHGEDTVALQRSERQLRLAEQMADLGSYDWNPVTGELHWSDQHYTLWGLVPRSVAPDYALFHRGVHLEDRHRLEGLLQGALASGGGYRCKHRVVWPDGTVRHIQAHGEVSLDANGRACRVVGTVQDITRRQAAEAQMQRDAFIVNAITDPVSLVDGGRVYHLVNDAWVQDTGVTRAAIVGQAPGEFQRLVRSDERDQALARCVQQGQRQRVMRHIQIPGKPDRWMETTMFPYSEPEGIGHAAVLVTRDVTAALASQRALADSVDNLRLTLNATQDGIFASDASAPGDPLLFVNRRLLEIWQMPDEPALQITPKAIIDAAQRFFIDPQRELARIAEVIASDTPQEDRLQLNDGRVLLRRCEPTETAGRQVRVWSFRDATHEDRALQALQTSAARQRALLDAFPGYLLRFDSQLRYTYVNARTARLAGRTPAETIGRTVAELAGDEEATVIAVERAQRALAGQSLRFERVYTNPAGGPSRQVQVTLEPGSDPTTGEPVVFGFGIDITSLKHTEAALIKARDDAEQASRAKSLFLSSMSHELRTPMNAVLGFAQVLAGDAGLSPRQRDQAEQIRLGGSHLLALINDLLDLARIESDQLDVQLQPVALADLVATCLELVAGHARQRQVRLMAPDLPPVTVQADPRRLQQVLLNLLDNAIKYNQPGGWVQLGWALQGPRVRCSVIDSGPGIALAQQPRLFQLFERLDAHRSTIEGTGIGLALCARLLKLMRGEIGVDSLPGSGSTFWFQLDGVSAIASPAPPAPDAAGAAGATGATGAGGAAGTGRAAATLPWAPPPGRCWRVLCIEDNPVNLMVIEALLSDLPGLSVQGIDSPVDGLARALADPPDLVLLDIQMPGLDGYQVLAALRADPATRQVPVIAASADAMPQAVARGLAAGFADYLTKPLEREPMLAAVQLALAGGSAPR